MFLKQLEVIGFKSFANKIAIEFVPGVTAVVGPNGSGKSNITEAIRWVLGEQSAKSLRGSKMEDIIFAGSDSKKSLNMAEVTLTLDNNDQYLSYDYSEISITRRVFRSGDSEFFINGQSCRLKDIVNLFMDSGLGREAYSVIGQGKIDEILNSKAEDRRRIFEEAAGVLKYKLRKQAAEKKLTESEDDLNRVEDILHELEDQIDPLEEQASIAKDYLEKKEDLKKIEVALLAHDIEDTHRKWEQKKASVARLDQQKSQHLRLMEEQDKHYQDERSKLDHLDHEIEEIQQGLLVSSRYLEKFEGQKNVLHERQKHAKENAGEMKERIDRLKRKQKQNEDALNSELTILEEEKLTLEKLKNDLKKKTKEFTFYDQDLDVIIEQLKSEYIDVLNKQASLRNEQRYVTEQLNQLDQRTSRSKSSSDDVLQSLKKIELLQVQAEKEIKDKQKEYKTTKQQFTELQQTVKSEKEAYAKQADAINKIRQFIQQAESRHDMLQSMSQDFAGFYQGVKQVLKARGHRLHGIHGAVAELLQVEKRYEKAIETALGGQAQHIVTQDEASARAAIQFLKKQQAGRATFLPLSVIKSKQLRAHDIERLKSHPSFVGIANELVQYKGVYQPAIEHLLGNIIIAEHLKGANDLAKLMQYRFRIVTLDGDVVSPGGAMSGGSQRERQVSLIGRNREISQLKIQLKEMKGKKVELEESFTTLKTSFVDHEMQLESYRDQLQQRMIEKEHLESRLREIEIKKANIQDKHQNITREHRDFQEEKKALHKRMDKLKKEQSVYDQKVLDLQNEINESTEKKKTQDLSKDELQEEITTLKIHVAKQQQMVTHLEDKTKEMKEQLDTLTSELMEATDSVQALHEHVSLHLMDQETINEKIKETREEKEKLTVELEKKKGARQHLQQDLNLNEQKLKSIQHNLDTISEELRQEDIKLERLDIQLDNLIDALREDYELSFESAKENYPLTIEADEARTKVKLIKKAIAELGVVNLGAIEEYERVSSRWNFLTNQRDDLLKARETLIGVMDEMDEEVTKRFSETFYKVRDEFKEVFKSLFGGGEADLKLLDPNDLLYSGVDILAQPPGKKLQNLSLLSGGERALTAIALLFAILKVRPVPFCVLDEVEAALDDANVDRYADFLKTFSQETQFIVVTHRKGTMEKADVLYGVTMQESGVSNLVSVRLEETSELLATS
ncbi:chromosome segregation protein SMC [Terrilactibacillus sp. BCM23-1]|uniref:Chromosome partition protein Smc n=1 Tax=Terrilactibacillus tamarindi TaxID=2599694 RepID=A0A6N8CTE0_9BACI|nr:chromosome segregation protein SMC [Terrilactibacillus tamarindi]MTT32303.1 chromosome segregation protein SMC [Terrilactibacillus tamarindi]